MRKLIAEIAEATMHYPFKVWGFGEGIALEALWEADEISSGSPYRQFVLDCFERWLERDIQEADHSAPGMLLLVAYKASGDERYLRRALELAQHMRALPQHDNGAAFHRPQHPDYHDYLYVDCIEVDAPFLCRLATVTGDLGWFDAAVEQLTGYATLLQDEQTGLFYHQYNRETNRINGAFWGRGNGWALLGLTKTLEQLPHDHPEYTGLMARYQRLCRALADCQSADGGWHTVLDDSDSYQESSLPAMFGLGLLHGNRHGWLDASFQRHIDAAWQAMLDALDDGLLMGVSVATPPGDGPHYNQIATGSGFPWGQGPALAFALARFDDLPHHDVSSG